MKAELLSTDTGIVLCADVWKRGYFPVSKAEGRQTVVIVEKVLSLFLFVEFEIICDSVGWMRAENAWIQTAGYAFRRAAGEIKISPAALRIRFLFTLYQSIFEPLFSHMLQIISNLNSGYAFDTLFICVTMKAYLNRY